MDERAQRLQASKLGTEFYELTRALHGGARSRNALILVGPSAAGVIRNHRERFVDLWLTAYDLRR